MQQQLFWRAEVYTDRSDTHGRPGQRKVFAGIYLTRRAAQAAAERHCQQARGFGFFIHAINFCYANNN